MGLRTQSHLAQVDGEDGVRTGALGVHLSAGRGAGQSAEFQTLEELREHRTQDDVEQTLATSQFLGVQTLGAFQLEQFSLHTGHIVH